MKYKIANLTLKSATSKEVIFKFDRLFEQFKALKIK